jgi:hypothetical protein
VDALGLCGFERDPRPPLGVEWALAWMNWMNERMQGGGGLRIDVFISPVLRISRVVVLVRAT